VNPINYFKFSVSTVSVLLFHKYGSIKQIPAYVCFNILFCYFLQDGYCHISDSMDRAKITGFVNVTSGDLDALKTAVALHGPISVAIDASHRTFSFYSHGVYYEPECGEYFLFRQCISWLRRYETCKKSFDRSDINYCPAGNTVEELDHAVLAVGYGKLDGQDYWLVKNSWSNYWGNSGFVLMSQKDNNCGVATDPTYVNIA